MGGILEMLSVYVSRTTMHPFPTKKKKEKEGEKIEQ
jgi:hypothetical protein